MNGNRWWQIWILVIVFGLASGVSVAGEHPSEHPEKAKSSTEAKGSDTRHKALTKAELADAVVAHVKKQTKLHGGTWSIYDSVDDVTLALKLKKVHRDKLATIGDGVYFACADFVTPEGKVYDIDIFMKDQGDGKLQATEVSVHKEAGVPRYTWHEMGGTWHKKSLLKDGEHQEHPGSTHDKEHPKKTSEHPAEHPK